MKRYILDIAKAGTPSRAGLKASNLVYLMKAGFPVPKTYICPFKAYQDYISGKSDVLTSLQSELANLIVPHKKYVIRSSADIEDRIGYSFAGQFESYLNLISIDEIMKAIEAVWQSIYGERVVAYAGKVNRSIDAVRMAAIIQEMVYPELSGVAFTKNPVTGMDEIIVESVAGSGDELVQRGLTPDRWVYKWGNWIELPENRVKQPVIEQVTAQAINIAKKYGRPVDLEWVYDGGTIYWLQLREITALKGINVYSNRIAKEFLPGIIHPLIWSVNIAVVNYSWKKLFIELIGNAARNIEIDRLAKSFYYRAYFNMGVVGDVFQILGMPRESIEIIMGLGVPSGKATRMKPGIKTLRYIPSLVRFFISKALFFRRMDRFLISQKRKYDRYHGEDISRLSMRETQSCIDDLMKLNTGSSYFVIVSQLTMGLYNMLLKTYLGKLGIDIRTISFSAERRALVDIDVDYHFSQLHEKYLALPEDTRRRLKTSDRNELEECQDIEDFDRDVEQFIRQFGHLSESGNDFSKVPWRETPDQVMNMIINYQKPASRQSGNIEISTIPVSPIQRWFIKKLYGRALNSRVYREKVNFLYVGGYALFRPYFLHMAQLFRESGFIVDDRDIFYLTLNEIRETVASGDLSDEYRAKWQQRKEEIARYQYIELPGIIIGDATPAPLINERISDKLKGLGTSPGYAEGRVKVIKGMHDFPKMEDGCIMIIPYSDISWTPLFSRAKAIISESGGMLSHSSIVAREYGIPAVVSVPNALRLDDDISVAVDGFNGEVTVLRNDRQL